MLHNKTMMNNFIVIVLTPSISSFNFYMIGFYLKYIGGNVYFNNSLQSSSMAFSFLFTGYLAKKVKSKTMFPIMYLVSVLFGIPLLIINPLETDMTWIASIGLFGG